VPEALTITVGIATRNRPLSLVRCVESLALLDDLVTEIIVADDASDVPAADTLAGIHPSLAAKLRIVRHAAGAGPIAGRNSIMRLAVNDYVLSLDDDAYILDATGIVRAVALMDTHRSIAAVACAQAEADGAPWPAGMQPAPVSYACAVPAFIGFSGVIRCSAFQAVGGYRESLHFYGEEKDLCVRLWDAGYVVVYLPDVRVAHVPDRSGRSDARYVRYVIRNDCLFAVYNEPLPMALVSIPLRLGRYVSMRRGARLRDPGGLTWIVTDLAKHFWTAVRERRPVKWATLRRWRRVRREWPAYGRAAVA
jgi:GT2 family glycosyltransferase